MAWQARNNFSPNDKLHAADLNNLSNDDRSWGGNVNGGGHTLSNVILSGSGSFEYLPSPVQITPGGDSRSLLQLDQTVTGNQLPRWLLGKDAAAESGGNAGSNFSIARYADDGVTVLGTPISISRATGLITMGSTLWNGPVDGGGQTLTNVVLAGVVQSFNARTGAVVLTAADITSATGVLNTRQILTDSTMSGGGDLTADRTLGVVADTTTQRIRVSQTGALVGTRRELNFTQAGSATVTITDDSANNRINIAIGATGGSGGAQTPWISNIDAAGFNLNNAGRVGIGIIPSTELFVASMSTNAIRGIVSAQYSDAPSAANIHLQKSRGTIAISAPVQANDNLGTVGVWGQTSAGGMTLGGQMIFSVSAVGTSTLDTNLAFLLSSSAGIVERMRITSVGNVGIGTANPRSALHVSSSAGAETSGITISQAVDEAAAYRIYRNAPDGFMHFRGDQTGFSGFSFRINATTETVRITNQGLVGIGLAAPQALLEIAQAISQDPTLSAACGINVLRASNTGVQMAIGMGSGSATYGGWFQSKFYTHDGRSFPIHLSPLGGGVTIGTMNPSTYALHVQGDVNVSGVYRVNGTPISGGGVTTQTAPARTAGTLYQNNTGKPMFISAGFGLPAGQNISLAADASNPPATTVSYVSNASGSTQVATVSGWVLPGHFYRVIAPGGGSQYAWVEWN